MNTIDITYYKSPYGELIIGSIDHQLCLCDWRYRKQRDLIDKRLKNFAQAEFKESVTPVIQQTINQLELYFNGNLKSFDLPLKLIGSDFQQSVWQELLNIPYGKTLSYMELSKKLDHEKAIRAVASANGANAISIIVPCHRVVGSHGELTGYAGGIRVKEKLLALERLHTTGEQQLRLEL